MENREDFVPVDQSVLMEIQEYKTCRVYDEYIVFLKSKKLRIDHHDILRATTDDRSPAQLSCLESRGSTAPPWVLGGKLDVCGGADQTTHVVLAVFPRKRITMWRVNGIPKHT